MPGGSCTLREPRSRDLAPLASRGHVHSSPAVTGDGLLGLTTAAYAVAPLQYTAGVRNVHRELPSAHEISRSCVRVHRTSQAVLTASICMASWRVGRRWPPKAVGTARCLVPVSSPTPRTLETKLAGF